MVDGAGEGVSMTGEVGYLGGGGVDGGGVSGEGERVGGINTTCGFVETVIGVIFTVLRRVGERGDGDGELASGSMPGLGSRKEAGGMKAGLPK